MLTSKVFTTPHVSIGSISNSVNVRSSTENDRHLVDYVRLQLIEVYSMLSCTHYAITHSSGGGSIKMLYNLVLLSLSHAYDYLPAFPGQLAYANPSGLKGKSVAKINLVPYHALVFYPNWFCSGAIIGSKIILTAAGCLLEPNAKISVKVGVDSIIDDGQTIGVVEVKIHEFYQHLNQLDNDIALLVLENHVRFGDNVQKIVMAGTGAALRPASSFVATGWGSSHNGQQHRFKKLVWAPLMLHDKVECHNEYGVFLSPSTFCGRYEQLNRLSDNGGPAVYDSRFLVGITSYTGPDNPTFAIFTNISYFHRWIKINTIRLHLKHCKIGRDSDSDYDNLVYDET